MSPVILISIFLLLLTVAWSLYAEFFGLRPWRSYQEHFRQVYSTYLQKQVAARRTAEANLYNTPDYIKLKATVDSATAAAAPKDRDIQTQVDLIDSQRAAITPSFQDGRGRVGALTYQLEQISMNDKDARASKQKELDAANASQYPVNWPTEKGVVTRNFTAPELNATFTDLMTRRRLWWLSAENDQPAKDAQAALDEFVKEKLPGLGAADLAGLHRAFASWMSSCARST